MVAGLPGVGERVIKLPRLHPGQVKLLENANRFNVWSCGRRFGKSELDKVIAGATMLEGGSVGYFVPKYSLLEDFWRGICAEMAPVTTKSLEKSHRLEIYGGGILECWTLLDPDAGRSKHYDTVLIDEAGLCPNLSQMWEENISPTLMDFQGNAFIKGTPKGRNNFWELYQQGLDPQEPEWSCEQLPTSMNPFIRPTEIARSQRMMSERRFQQEILAEFLVDGGAVFRNVKECSTGKGIIEPVRNDGRKHDYIMGVDWGRTDDYTCVSVIDATDGEQVYLDRFHMGFKVMKARWYALMDIWKPVVCAAESNSFGKPLVEDAQGEGYNVIKFVTSNQSKSVIVDELAMAMEQNDVVLLNDEVQKFELMAFEGTELPSGLTRYAAPEGENNHDDTVMALMIAWHHARHYRPIVEPVVQPMTDEEAWNAVMKRLKGTHARDGSIYRR